MFRHDTVVAFLHFRFSCARSLSKKSRVSSPRAAEKRYKRGARMMDYYAVPARRTRRVVVEAAVRLGQQACSVADE
jgi:hypothetical protein